MQRKSKSPKACLLILIIGFLVVSVVFVAFFFLRNKQQQTRINVNMSPSVIINSPRDSETVSAGSPVFVHVTTAAQNPIARVEFWLDGTRVETQTPTSSPENAINFDAVSEIIIYEGLHLFYARVVDSDGLVGQSIPIAIQGSPQPATTEIDAEEGQTLTEIAEAQGALLGDLHELNRDLENNPLPGGTKVVIPAPQSQNQPPANPSGAGNPSIIPPAPLPVIPQNVISLVPINLPKIDLGLILSLTSQIPKAPNSFQAGYDNCTIRLAWMDNSDNEQYFRVWMQAMGGPAKIIATLKGASQTGPAWYEFASPQTGIYSFWVDAVNTIGWQPSEIQWVGVTDLSCSPGVATHLVIETLDMYVISGYDQVYCYLSVEDQPEQRIPTNDSQFIPVLAGWGDVSNWTGSGNTFVLPEPQDNVVTLEGQCLGWQGGSGPDNLGAFKSSAARETWDGRRMELKGKGSGYTIGYRVQSLGSTQAAGFFTFIDYTLTPPISLNVTTETSSNPDENEKLARRPTLSWKWAGDESKLTGFTIFLDGKFFRKVPNWQGGQPGEWDQMFLIPTSCGRTYKFQVAANTGDAQSAPSAVFEYQQPACWRYAEITFDTIEFSSIDDGERVPWWIFPTVNQLPCDTAEARIYMWVNAETHFFGHVDIYGCATHNFIDLVYASPQRLTYAHPTTFTVPIGYIGDPIHLGINMIDHDTVSPDDTVCNFRVDDLVLAQSFWDQAEPSLHFEERCVHDDGSARVYFTVKGFTGAPLANP